MHNAHTFSYLLQDNMYDYMDYVHLIQNLQVQYVYLSQDLHTHYEYISIHFAYIKSAHVFFH